MIALPILSVEAARYRLVVERVLKAEDPAEIAICEELVILGAAKPGVPCDGYRQYWESHGSPELYRLLSPTEDAALSLAADAAKKATLYGAMMESAEEFSEEWDQADNLQTLHNSMALAFRAAARYDRKSATAAASDSVGAL